MTNKIGEEFCSVTCACIISKTIKDVILRTTLDKLGPKEFDQTGLGKTMFCRYLSNTFITEFFQDRHGPD